MSRYASDEKGPLFLVTAHRYMNDTHREFLINAPNLRTACHGWAENSNWGSSRVRRATPADVERIRGDR